MTNEYNLEAGIVFDRRNPNTNEVETLMIRELGFWGPLEVANCVVLENNRITDEWRMVFQEDVDSLLKQQIEIGA